MTETGIGARVKRKEDFRFLTGQGTYTDDINRHGQAHACFLRSPHAHAKLGAINAAKAKAMPGVLAVFTHADLAADKVGGVPCGFGLTQKNGKPQIEPPHPALAAGKVRYAGDAVAMVVAETLAQARDAAEAIEVGYSELPAVVDTAGAPRAKSAVHDEAPNNVCFEWEIGDKAKTDEAFAKAANVSKLEFVNNRLIPNAMEPRAAVGEYDRATGNYTLYTTSQNPHVIRLLMGAFVLAIPEHRLRVVAPDVGGGFGSKIFHYAEEALVTWACRKVGRPVKWTAERSESFLTDAHGRDHVTKVELATDREGNFLGLRVHSIANLGAYLSTFAPMVPTWLYAPLFAGQYRTPAIHAEVIGVFTNTSPVDAYRGAGRPEATYVVERIVETAARDLKLDPAEIRRKNFIAPAQFPYTTPVVLQYDSGQYALAMDKACQLIDYKNFAKRKAEAEKRGRLRGIGFSAYIEACGVAPSAVAGAIGARAGLYEAGVIRFHPTGSVTVITGTHSHGQGHETTFAQLVSDRLGVPYDSIDVVHGDTDRIPFGMGTYGSRSIAVGGSALSKAMDKIVDKGKRIAAHLMEAAVQDIEFKNGAFRVAGTDKQKTIQEVAFAAYVPHNYPLNELEPGLEETAYYDPANFTYPAGTHIAEVEVDPQTGQVEVVDWAAVDDFGNVINPMIVEGQVHGGIAQGIGQALLEGCVYDDRSGQLVTGSYMDYCMPRADNLPSYRVDMTHTPCPHNPLGVKGCGEAGAIAAPAALMNAITNALGIKDLAMPATPERVWRAAQARGARAAE
ncbi:MAG: xanthine dehydrogenase family protein molybdopterin-binding subunit [Alphaproteobacteria bacterium]|nr:xanthine dehydrogenase family protein molybdopterin-binding subunit [Alphaproteobacteria bacterium]